MDDHRQVRATEVPGEAVQARRVVEVTVTAYDGLDVLWIEVEAAHVLHHPVWAGAEVED